MNKTTCLYTACVSSLQIILQIAHDPGVNLKWVSLPHGKTGAQFPNMFPNGVEPAYLGPRRYVSNHSDSECSVPPLQNPRFSLFRGAVPYKRLHTQLTHLLISSKFSRENQAQYAEILQQVLNLWAMTPLVAPMTLSQQSLYVR